MKAYKLLSQDMTSYNNTKWEIGKKVEKPDIGSYKMCSSDVLHCYSDPLLAVFLNPIHTNIYRPRLFEIEIDRVVATDGLKCASLVQVPTKELKLPKLTTEQRVEVAIRCSLLTDVSDSYKKWAANWLDGTDRTAEAAEAAARAAEAAARAAARAAAWAAWAGRAAWAAEAAAWAAARAAEAAAEAAEAAAWAAEDMLSEETILNILKEVINK